MLKASTIIGSLLGVAVVICQDWDTWKVLFQKLGLGGYEKYKKSVVVALSVLGIVYVGMAYAFGEDRAQYAWWKEFQQVQTKNSDYQVYKGTGYKSGNNEIYIVVRNGKLSCFVFDTDINGHGLDGVYAVELTNPKVKYSKDKHFNNIESWSYNFILPSVNSSMDVLVMKEPGKPVFISVMPDLLDKNCELISKRWPAINERYDSNVAL